MHRRRLISAFGWGAERSLVQNSRPDFSLEIAPFGETVGWFRPFYELARPRRAKRELSAQHRCAGAPRALRNAPATSRVAPSSPRG